MELVFNSEFCEMPEEELVITAGGSLTLGGVLAGAGTVWICYEIGYAIGKAIAHATS